MDIEQLTAHRRSEVISIQYMRAVAAIMVAIFHIGNIFQYKLYFGGNGVDIFFVISGFIMWMITRRRETNPANFIMKRIIRIVPLYWLVTLVLIVCVSLKPNLFPMDRLVTNNIISSFFFIPSPNPAWNSWFTTLPQGWTLNYEMFFYVIFTVSLMMRRYQFYILNAILLSCVVYGFFTNPPLQSNGDYGHYIYTSSLLLEFLAGIYICRAWLEGGLLSKKWALATLGLGISAMIGAYICGFNHPRAIANGLPAALIVYAMVSLEQRELMPKWNWLKFLGDASYSIYLTHFQVWVAVSIITVKLGGTIKMSLYFYFLTLIAAIIAGSVTYVLIEKPMTGFLNRKLPHKFGRR